MRLISNMLYAIFKLYRFVPLPLYFGLPRALRALFCLKPGFFTAARHTLRNHVKEHITMLDPQPFETTGSLNEGGLYPFDPGKDSCGVSFVADLKNRASHSIVQRGLTALERLNHRGACGCEENTGDGAGVLTQLPDRFLRKVFKAQGLGELPTLGAYGVGMVFLPRGAKDVKAIKAIWDRIVREEGQTLLGWRSVPVDNSMVGPTALKNEPGIEQVFIARNRALRDQDS